MKARTSDKPIPIKMHMASKSEVDLSIVAPLSPTTEKALRQSCSQLFAPKTRTRQSEPEPVVPAIPLAIPPENISRRHVSSKSLSGASLRQPRRSRAAETQRPGTAHAKKSPPPSDAAADQAPTPWAAAPYSFSKTASARKMSLGDGLVAPASDTPRSEASPRTVRKMSFNSEPEIPPVPKEELSRLPKLDTSFLTEGIIEIGTAHSPTVTLAKPTLVNVRASRQSFTPARPKTAGAASDSGCSGMSTLSSSAASWMADEFDKRKSGLVLSSEALSLFPRPRTSHGTDPEASAPGFPKRAMTERAMTERTMPPLPSASQQRPDTLMRSKTTMDVQTEDVPAKSESPKTPKTPKFAFWKRFARKKSDTPVPVTTSL